MAMANLAYKFIGEGFLDEANGLTEKALSVKEFHQNVASARARIDEVKQKEEDREQEILNGVAEEREFRLAFAEATYVKPDQIPPITGRWKTPYGDIEINITNGVLGGIGVSKETEDGLLPGLLWGQFPSTPVQVTKTIELKSNVHGAAARGQITIETKRGTILTSTKQEFKVHLIIISTNRMRVLQVDEKGVISIANLDRFPEG